jgi:acetyl-CoA carboxylase biotin carboxylase subunit
MFAKVLIANRGEIALRIIRACRELQIKTVAVYSEADMDSLHVHYADESVCIGPPELSSSYLNISRIISAAEITNADAIHPGYGLLAENAHFAEICEACQLQFIGPSAENIRLMGDKAAARKLAMDTGVPVVEGSHWIISVKEEALELASQIGYPLMIKATAGGGGKGMRVVHSPEDFLQSFATAGSEAQAAFGNPGLYLERYIENPRHVEFQILGDRSGNLIHLGERDCSIQRRHQKLIEESPSLGLKQRLRERMGKAAVAVAKAGGYTNLGTVEFLLDSAGNFSFLEMNTRIQVEHPVTEMVTGIDLVKEQIRLAAGEPLRFKQEEIELRGHSIECRINAEDPERFIPSPGKITEFRLPGGPGVRVDTHCYPGYVITPYYDSLIAKVIVQGEDRREAIARARRAMEEFVIEGIKTTIPFHQRVFMSPDFVKGRVNTGFLETLSANPPVKGAKLAKSD